jgi:hypothetical protein
VFIRFQTYYSVHDANVKIWFLCFLLDYFFMQCLVIAICFRFLNDDWSFFSERIITSGGFHKQGHKKRNDSSGNCLISIWTVFDLHDTRVILAFVRIGNDRKISSWEIFCIRTSINSFQIAVSSIQPLKYVTYCDNQVVDLLLAFEHQCFEHNDESQSLFLANVNKS